MIHQQGFPIQFQTLGNYPLENHPLENHQPYEEVIQKMDHRVQRIILNQEQETIWSLCHSSVYTIGTSGKEADLWNGDPSIPVVYTKRGGQITYHGEGQRIYYIMIGLKKRHLYIHDYLRLLEQWIIHILKAFHVVGYTIPKKTGVWVWYEGQHKKIAAIGVRVHKWVTSHGMSFNINPDLSYYKVMNPCGMSLRDYGVTSLQDLHVSATAEEVDKIAVKTCPFSFIV